MRDVEVTKEDALAQSAKGTLSEMSQEVIENTSLVFREAAKVRRST